MNMAAFVRRNRPRWKRLEELLQVMERRRRLIGVEREVLQELSRLYRSSSSDLAYAQTHYRGTTVLQFLHQLVGRAHHQIYRTEPLTLGRVWRFVRVEVPQTARQYLPAMLMAAIMLVTSFALGLAAAEADPRIASLVLPSEVLEDIYAGRMWTEQIFSAVPPSVSSAVIFTNNITVAFLCFVGGMTLGLYTAFILILNGFMLGVVFKICAQHGLTGELIEFTASHGWVEMSVIVVSGAAGFILASSLLDPGDQTRRDALSERGLAAAKLALGAVPPLILMGLIESFVSPMEGVSAWFKVALGLALGAAYWSYLLGGGSGAGPGRPAPATSGPSASARNTG